MPYDTFLTFLDEPALIWKFFSTELRGDRVVSLHSKDPQNDDFDHIFEVFRQDRPIFDILINRELLLHYIWLPGYVNGCLRAFWADFTYIFIDIDMRSKLPSGQIMAKFGCLAS